MQRYEYKVVAAPNRGKKGKGIRTPEARFANALELLMNDLGAEGWDYVRSDMLPLEERSGLTKTTTSYKHVLVFRRLLESDAAEYKPKLLPTPVTIPAEGATPAITLPETSVIAEDTASEEDETPQEDVAEEASREIEDNVIHLAETEAEGEQAEEDEASEGEAGENDDAEVGDDAEESEEEDEKPA